MTNRDRRLAGYYARLASISEFKNLPTKERRQLIGELWTLLRENTPLPPAIPGADARESAGQQAAQDRLMGGLQLRVKEVLCGLVDGAVAGVHGAPVRLRLDFFYRVRDGRSHVTVGYYQSDEGHITVKSSDQVILGPLLDLIPSGRRFPFARCCQCRRVFVLARRGKPGRYCSARCKAKGAPSAARRTEYMRNFRRRHRKQEVDKAKQALRGIPSTQQYDRLRQLFPEKPRRALVYLLKQIHRPKARHRTNARNSHENALARRWSRSST